MDLDPLPALGRLAGQDGPLDTAIVQLAAGPSFRGMSVTMPVRGVRIAPPSVLRGALAG